MARPMPKSMRSSLVSRAPKPSSKVLRHLAVALTVVFLGGCQSSPDATVSVRQAIAEVSARENRFPSYPQAGKTYLTFTLAHGFQVNYLGNEGRGYLWYPGNHSVVREQFKRDIVRGRQALCWRHPENSRNPVTRKVGGGFVCESLEFAQRTVVTAIDGDFFNLRSGRVPSVLDRCVAPYEFTFDRRRFTCR